MAATETAIPPSNAGSSTRVQALPSGEVQETAPVQEGAEFYAIIPGGPGALVVGAFGAPDSYVPEVWQSPAR